MINYLTRYPVTLDWAGHKAEGLAGGHDRRTPVGTAILAPAAGLVRAAYVGGIGWTVTVVHDDGTSTQFLHLLELDQRLIGQRVPAGRHLGRSGWGGKWIHGHSFDARGIRIPALYESATAPAADTITPLPTTATPARPPEDDMTVYLLPTENSSPITPPKTASDPNPTPYSRIWTGYRTIGGIEYADVWGVDGDGDAHRLVAKHWRILNDLADRGLVTLNVVPISGNDLEQIVYALEL